MRSFAGKVAAITGAGSGIGRALALELARRQCHLALSNVDETALAETARLAGQRGVTVTCARVDVADREQRRSSRFAASPKRSVRSWRALPTLYQRITTFLIRRSLR